MNRTACFTGHRPNKFPTERDASLARNAINTAVNRAISEGYTNFIVGGALGIDTFAAQAVITARASHPNIKLFVAVPFRGFTSRWSAKDREVYASIIRQADGYRVCSASPSKSAYHVRNHYMVDHSDLVIAFYNGDASGGTAATVRYAKSVNKPIYNCYCKLSNDR